MSRRRFSRRRFLRGASAVGAAATLGIPFLPSLRPAAAAGEFPTRFVFMWWPQGTVMDDARPSVSGEDVSLDGATYPDMIAPIEPFRDKTLVVRNLDNVIGGPYKNGHPRGTGQWLTGKEMIQIGVGTCSNSGREYPQTIGGGISVDQIIADAQDTTYASLELAVRTRRTDTAVRTTLSYRGPEMPLTMQPDPAAVYRRLWGDGVEIDEEARRRQVRDAEIRLRALDLARDRLDVVRDRVASEDRLALEAHWDSLNSIERRLVDRRDGSATLCSTPELGTMIDPYRNENYEEVGRLQMDILAEALACDMTRVATFQWDRAGSTVLFDWLDGVSEHHHDLAHANEGAQLRSIGRWYHEQLAYFLQRLDSIPQGDKTLLDYTVLVWANGMREGNRHNNVDLPVMLFGGGDGFFKTNRSVDVGMPHNHLLVSLCHAMGLTDVQTVGETDHRGPATALHAV